MKTHSCILLCAGCSVITCLLYLYFSFTGFHCLFHSHCNSALNKSLRCYSTIGNCCSGRILACRNTCNYCLRLSLTLEFLCL